MRATAEGSNPIARSSPHQKRVFATLPPLEGPSKADAHLHAAIEAFLLNRRVGNCSARTLQTYAYNLQRFAQATGIVGLLEVTPLIVCRRNRFEPEPVKPSAPRDYSRQQQGRQVWPDRSGR